ncbi:unnamed protein product [Sphenostylis stenocarpa]|uniref:Pentatricopeptide repeat-containing protein n=1 Tax=Sphenostylis stenocarpa TaxID=92480 RepID=A0AA86RUM3_9FABA|nr:unnamed protein product [Sphenostylis stenocarpa]
MEKFKQVHAQILKLGLFWDSFCGSNLVAPCASSRWGSMEYDCSIFRQTGEPGSFEHNTTNTGNINSMNLEKDLLFYVEMLERGIETDNTYLPLCTQDALKEGAQIHGQVFKADLEDDIFVQIGLIGMYGECWEIKHGILLQNISELNVVVKTSLIDSYVKCGSLEKGLSFHGCGTDAPRVFTEMLEEGLAPDDVVYVGHYGCMVDHMGRAGMLKEAYDLITSTTIKPNDVV